MQKIHPKVNFLLEPRGTYGYLDNTLMRKELIVLALETESR